MMTRGSVASRRSRRIAALVLAVLMAAAPVSLRADCTPISTMPGALDTCFAVNGYEVFDLTGTDAFQATNALAVQSDGKLVAAGYFRPAGSQRTEAFLLRYTRDGELDMGFGSSGIVTTAALEQVLGALVQPDGKIVIVGAVPKKGKGKSIWMFAVARFLPDGSIDSQFGASGVATVPFDKDSWGYAAVVQPDGRMVIAGSFRATSTGSLVPVVRLMPNGALDPSFGSSGKVTISFGRKINAAAYDLALDALGRPIIAGETNRDGFVIRLTVGGALDPTFGAGGMVIADFGTDADYFRAVTIDSAGRVVAAGRAGANTGVARYLSNGAPDPDFGVEGKAGLDIPEASDSVEGLAIQPDGRIVLAGTALADDFTSSRTIVARLNTDGSLDDGSAGDLTPGDEFGTAGVTIAAFSPGSDRAAGVVLQSDDDGEKLVVAAVVDGARRVGLSRYYQ